MTLYPPPTRAFWSRIDAAIERWNRAERAAVFFINNGSWPERADPDTITDATTCLDRETRKEAIRQQRLNN